MSDKPKKTGARRLPEWLKRPIPKGQTYQNVVQVLDELRLETVCSGASCPNLGECFSKGTATFMIMGGVCTRNCRFCAVTHGSVQPLEDDEPRRIAEGVKRLALRYVVITSVTRDDLSDGGAEHFAKVIQAVRDQNPDVQIEVLTPDFQGSKDCLDRVCQAKPDVFNHNLETTRRLTPVIRSGADYQRSLEVLAYVAGKEHHPIVKSGFMLGLGETPDGIMECLQDLQAAGVQMLTIGQYLRPGPDNHPVEKYYPPEEFDQIAAQARQLGFQHVAAGPFVRSSYHAESSFQDTPITND